MTSMAQVLSLGETMVIVTPVDGGRLSAVTRFGLASGGAESNGAAMLSELGVDSAWAGYVDPFVRLILDLLADIQVDTSRVETLPNKRTGVYFKDRTDARTTVYYYRADSAAAQVDSSYLTHLRELSPEVAHVSGVTPSCSIDRTRVPTDIARLPSPLTIEGSLRFDPQEWPVGTTVSEVLVQ